MAAKKENKRTEKEAEVLEPKKVIACHFCASKTEPDYKEYKVLDNFVSRRAKIAGSKRSGLCAKHQRRLSKEVKRARHLGLLPFTINL